MSSNIMLYPMISRYTWKSANSVGTSSGLSTNMEIKAIQNTMHCFPGLIDWKPLFDQWWSIRSTSPPNHWNQATQESRCANRDKNHCVLYPEAKIPRGAFYGCELFRDFASRRSFFFPRSSMKMFERPETGYLSRSNHTAILPAAEKSRRFTQELTVAKLEFEYLSTTEKSLGKPFARRHLELLGTPPVMLERRSYRKSAWSKPQSRTFLKQLWPSHSIY